jgi:hypothetical protein
MFSVQSMCLLKMLNSVANEIIDSFHLRGHNYITIKKNMLEVSISKEEN